MSNIKSTAIRAPTDDPANHTVVLRQLKETTEIAQRLRGDPLDSFVRVSELLASGIIRFTNGQIQPPLGGSYVPSTRNVNTADSLTGGGALSADLTLTLVGDVVSPGNTMVYGTNGAGVRGWYGAGMGPPGPTGPAGAAGPPGISGEDGMDGDHGPPGERGPAGATGISNVPGPVGPPGDDGLDGDHGPPGERGPAGAAGLAGAAGTPGFPGDDGLDGDHGPPGERGATGAVGAVGPLGPPGDDGLDGDHGPPGERGLTGLTGPTGLYGPPGDDGLDGDHGPPGERGATGVTGAVGPLGPPGDDGLDGDHGPPGERGATGVTGAVGPLGPPGDDGLDGDHGPPGERGLAGAAGISGAVGPLGPNGEDGMDGEVGPPGPPGPAPVGATPTALVGLTPIAGSATTVTRSDGAPALDQSITPVWTGNHQFAGTGTQFGTDTATNDVNIDGPAGTNRQINFYTAGLLRWTIRVNSTAEGGSNTGSLLEILRYTDAGTIPLSVLLMNRGNNNVTMGTGALIVGTKAIDVSPVQSGAIYYNSATKTLRGQQNGSTFDLIRTDTIPGPPGDDGLDGDHGPPGERGATGPVSAIPGPPGPPGEDGMDGSEGIPGPPIDYTSEHSWWGVQRFKNVGNVFGDGVNSETVVIDGGAGQNRQVLFRSGGIDRWGFIVDNTAESGGNAGSLFKITRFDDAGANPVTILSASRINNTLSFFSGVLNSYTPGGFAMVTGSFCMMTRRLQLTGAQRLTGQGSSRLRIT